MKKFLILTAFLPASLYAAGFMPSQSDYYYELGGTSNLFVPPINKDQTLRGLDKIKFTFNLLNMAG